ncbi:hypothetical protein [Actinocorallia sp. A-T 12471]|uniref:hypothetical protein n=1 Tax=Actinocorallia sp. A-T 12471 TaxID=3089813 RepID=UPI0029D23E2A|nr:hypothetical protein [Actinocorallia sp. A-T 12471]MDX6740585.1 hypothetical protein [Actinocorallia sp. A-T 12471]
MDIGWRRGPFGLDAEKGATVPGLKRVLAVVHHLTAATRLADVLPLVERDRRIQVVYTVAPASVLSGGTAGYLERLGAAVIPWAQATSTAFDLAVAAGNGGLEQVHAPVLWLPHGVGPHTLIHRWSGHGLPAPRPVAGLRPEAIVAGGRVIPSVIAVAREEHGEEVRRVCPEAAPAIVVTGDPAYDRIAASVGSRAAFRAALGVSPGQRLVLLSSTWGPRSLLGRHPDLPDRLAAELPAHDYRVVVAAHPNMFTWHGRRQVESWYSRHGSGLLNPEEGWGGALIAADLVVGDHGSVTYYSAALGVPVVLGAFPDGDVMPGSPVGLLGRVRPRLDLGAPLRGQLEEALGRDGSTTHDVFRARLTSNPGRSAEILRRTMYRLLGLSEPGDPARPAVLPPPRLIREQGSAAG